jgi:glutamine synthetase
MPPPEVLSVIDLARLSPEQQRAKGVHPLPASLGEALDCLEQDGQVLMLDAIRAPYLMHKRAELAEVADVEIDALCDLYSEAY